MSDSFEPKNEPKNEPINEHLNEPMDEPPPSPEELAAAARMVALLEGEAPTLPGIGETLPALEEDLAIAQFLRHEARPPTLAPARQDAIEATLMGLWDEVMPPQEVAASTPTTAPTPAPLSGWRLWLRNWLTPGPRLAMAGAFVTVLVLASNATLFMSAPPRTAKPHSTASQAQPTLLAAHLSDSPWQAGQDPFSTTRSPNQRLQRVLEHNSQQALESALAAQSRQHLMRLR